MKRILSSLIFATLAAQVFSQNVVLNPGFEIGPANPDTTAWMWGSRGGATNYDPTGVAGVTSNYYGVTARTGNCFTGLFASADSVYLTGLLAQTLNAGDVVTIRFWGLYTGVGYTGGPGFNIIQSAAATFRTIGYERDSLKTFSAAQVGVWQEFVNTFTVQNSGWDAVGIISNDAWAIDDVSVEVIPVPEPATLLTLAGGAFALASRRRGRA